MGEGPTPDGWGCSKPDDHPLSMLTGKTRGMGAGRKLQLLRRNQRWADKDFKKSHLGSEWKKPFAGASHAKGIVLEKIGIEAKQPNSAIRKCARVQLIKNGKKIAAFVPNDGCLNFIEENVSGAGHLSFCHGARRPGRRAWRDAKPLNPMPSRRTRC